MDIPKKIINEVAGKMLDNRIELEDIALVPNVFVIYLHRTNYSEIQFLLKKIREQIIVRLDKEIAKRGKNTAKLSGGWRKVLDFVAGINLSGSSLPLVVPDDWDVSFKATERNIAVGDDVFEINKDEICVVAGFSESNAEKTELDSVFKTFVTIYKTEAKESRNFEIKPDTPTVRNDFQNRSEAEKPSRDGIGLLARLTCKYNGEDETVTFEIKENKITVGRGSDCSFVLSKASERISRKHLEILFDEEKFYLKSFGIYGSTLQGKVVPMSEKVVENITQELDKKVEIPDKARIALAGGEILLDFVKVL